MHIPDGYLSLQTSIPAIGVMAPIWAVALKRIRKVFNIRQIPTLSLCAAFSFLIMMFNIPVGPSSVHAVGAVFIAILLGPWAATISVSVALLIQAVVFGDGGILAFGANCFNMAFIMPFAGYFIYKAIAGNSDKTSKRSIIATFLGAYIGISAAALAAALEFGIQPLLFKTLEGIPLYGFYPLSVSVPAIMFEHLLFAGPIEGIITVSGIAYLLKFSPVLFNRVEGVYNFQSMDECSVIKNKKTIFSRYKPFIVGLAVMILATPFGLIATGTAWGEWGVDEIKSLLGYVPKGITRLSGIWNSFLPDYSISGLGHGFFNSSVGYIVSAIVGVLLIALVMFITSKLIIKKENED